MEDRIMMRLILVSVLTLGLWACSARSTFAQTVYYTPAPATQYVYPSNPVVVPNPRITYYSSNYVYLATPIQQTTYVYPQAYSYPTYPAPTYSYPVYPAPAYYSYQRWPWSRTTYYVPVYR